jgi:hypothetical protein
MSLSLILEVLRFSLSGFGTGFRGCLVLLTCYRRLGEWSAEKVFFPQTITASDYIMLLVFTLALHLISSLDTCEEACGRYCHS